MIRMREIRESYQACLRANDDDLRAGSREFLRRWNHTLGLNADANPETGRDAYLFEDFRPRFGVDGRLNPREVDFGDLGEAILGRDFVREHYCPSGSPLHEAAIDPTSFININTFNMTIAGLLNARILEQFTSPAYMIDEMVTIIPTNMNGHKIIGTTGISPQTAAAKKRRPGEAHASVGFGEAWQTTPETSEQALKTEVTKEAAFFGGPAGGQVLERAGQVGDELAYGREKDGADTVLGVTGLASEYNRSGTSYETYQDTSPWINDQVNEFADVNDVDEARALTLGMTDPDTGREIDITLATILCNPFKQMLFQEQLFGTSVTLGTQVTSSLAQRITMTSPGLNTVNRGSITLRALTTIWHNRMISSTGLSLTATQAKGYWYYGEPKRAFEEHQNWPLTTWQGNASETDMKDRGIIAVHGANYRSEFFVREPRYMVRNKKS